MGLPLKSAIVLLLSSSSCSDDGSLFCAADDYRAWPRSTALFRCGAAVTFAARDTAELVPTQAEVDRYTNYWVRAIEAEPILDGRGPQRHRQSIGSPVAIFTTNPLVIDAWNRVVLETGDSAFDAIISQLYPDPQSLSPYGGHDNGDGSYLFTLDVHVVCNEELLQARLAPTSSKTSDAVVYMQDEGTWRWGSVSAGTSDDSDTATIEFTFGWGDCFSGCRGFHMLQAVVPPSGSATVYDLGGDLLPPELKLSPNTRPPP